MPTNRKFTQRTHMPIPPKHLEASNFASHETCRSGIGIDSDRKVMEYEQLLSACHIDDDDPIIHWMSYIDYMKRTFPSNERALLSTYKRCVQSLTHHLRYKHDQRFVRICIIYADRSENTLEQFEQLYRIKVGVKTAMLWMTWAWVAEKKGGYKLAETIFRKALEKKVEPVNVVVERFDQFRRRMDRRNTESISIRKDVKQGNENARPDKTDNEKENNDQESKIEKNAEEKVQRRRLNQKRDPNEGFSPDTSISGSKRQQTAWVQPRLVDISNVSPFIERFPRDKRQRKRGSRKSLGCGFDLNLLVQNGQDGSRIESCFERERAKLCRISRHKGYDFNRLLKRTRCDTYGSGSDFIHSGAESTHQAEAFDYDSLHKRDTERALEKMLNGVGTESKSNEFLHLVHLNLNQTLPRCLTRITKNGGRVDFDGIAYNIMHKLGSGSFGTALLCEAKLGETLEKEKKFALKVQRPTGCLAWEFLVLKMLQSRLNTKSRFTIPTAFSLSIFSDGGVMRMTAGSHSGLNLLDVVNFHKGNVPELIAIHYTSRMMLHMEVLHLEGEFLHCDIKPDNWIISSHPEIVSDVMLIDFGRAKDLKMLSDGATVRKLQGKVATEGLECIAMRNSNQWCFDIDTYGLCVCAHTLLFGNYMNVVKKEGKWKLRNPLRRYWQTPLWRLLFDCLINETSSSIREYGESIKSIRLAFQAHLDGRSRELKQLLANQTSQLPRQKN